MEIPDVRRRVRAAIEQAKRESAARRERSDAAAREYEAFLTTRAVPVFTTLASALVAEGHRFKVFTPVGSVRLSSERSADDYIELTFDSAEDPPAVIGRTSAGRGRRAITRERPVRPGASPDALTDEDVLGFLLTEIVALIER